MSRIRHLAMVVILMGFLGSLFGCSKGKDAPRYVTEQAYRDNVAKQIKMSPLTMAQLRKHGVTESKSLKLEFFFYTDAPAKAQGLVRALQGLQYEVQSGPSASNRRILVVTGWTSPMKMDDETVVAWTEKMCRLGYDHDAEFDGWGTNAE